MLVTGASRGIGAELASTLSQQGAKLILVAHPQHKSDLEQVGGATPCWHVQGPGQRGRGCLGWAWLPGDCTRRAAQEAASPMLVRWQPAAWQHPLHSPTGLCLVPAFFLISFPPFPFPLSPAPSRLPCCSAQCAKHCQEGAKGACQTHCVDLADSQARPRQSLRLLAALLVWCPGVCTPTWE